MVTRWDIREFGVGYCWGLSNQFILLGSRIWILIRYVVVVELLATHVVNDSIRRPCKPLFTEPYLHHCLLPTQRRLRNIKVYFSKKAILKSKWSRSYYILWMHLVESIEEKLPKDTFLHFRQGQKSKNCLLFKVFLSREL